MGTDCELRPFPAFLCILLVLVSPSIAMGKRVYASQNPPCQTTPALIASTYASTILKVYADFLRLKTDVTPQIKPPLPLTS